MGGAGKSAPPCHLRQAPSPSLYTLCALQVAATAAQVDEELSRLELAELQDLGILGSGSSGVVRKMRHLPTGRLICLKVRSCKK